MEINQLQIGLGAAGVAVVVGIFVFNKWQESRHKRMAEEIFKSDHPDVLLDEEPQPAVKAAQEEKPVRLVKPAQVEKPVPAEVSVPRVEAADAAIGGASVSGEAPPENMAPIGTSEAPQATQGGDDASLPGVDEKVDFAVGLFCDQAVSTPLFWPAQMDALPRTQRMVQWLGMDEGTKAWEVLNGHSTGRHQRFRVALQLVDRRGPVSEQELQAFVRGITALADRFQARVEMPALREMVPMALELDDFCARVDVQIALNVASRSGGFPGTKLRGLAEAGGLALQGDGAFHALDEAGRSLFTLTNAEGQPFAAETMRTVSTAGVSLTLDVPRVPDGAAVFNRMYLLAQQLANSLGGSVVDDNGAPLDERSVAVIRAKVGEFQQAMAARGLTAGGALALRLFS